MSDRNFAHTQTTHTHTNLIRTNLEFLLTNRFHIPKPSSLLFTDQSLRLHHWHWMSQRWPSLVQSSASKHWTSLDLHSHEFIGTFLLLFFIWALSPSHLDSYPPVFLGQQPVLSCKYPRLLLGWAKASEYCRLLVTSIFPLISSLRIKEPICYLGLY